MKIKVLILHTSVGHGIKITALNIAEELKKSQIYDPVILDFEELESGPMFTAGKKTYSVILEHISGLWGFLYNSKIVIGCLLPFREIFFSIKSQKLLAVLRKLQPAIIISTETIPSAVVSHLKSKKLYVGKLVVAFSDYHLHRFWLYGGTDLYLCNIAKQAEELRELGIPYSKIAVTGAMVSEKFLRPSQKEEALRQLNLLTTMPMVLLTSGALVRMQTKEIFLRLLRSQKSFQVVVVCGTNQRLKEELEKISPPSNHPVKILGYVNNMEILMSAASVLLGKTGGPTMVEAIVKKLPIIITDARPGHETKNLEFLLENGVVEFARNKAEAAFITEQILSGKKYNFEKAYEAIVKPKSSINLEQALSVVTPQEAEIQVKNYQETLA
ncbi:MAG: hypothetical protein HY336_01685 [Candidatus Doudnabacteria bacterium]|nr:hypothetical protein [Candidatus Doudnabacteria bacterium]